MAVLRQVMIRVVTSDEANIAYHGPLGAGPNPGRLYAPIFSITASETSKLA